ncbi:MAG: DUF805 domain-containing protein [Alphaproteobacteria bacterium]|nr:DUF805 domain-containing protein [Alphaproteobacteria bacterium]
MATRKTSADKDVKALSDDSKKTSATSKTTAAAKPAKKRSVKKDSVLKVQPADDTPVFHKANINPLDEVMEIKAHNEEVKTAKALKKAAKKGVKTLKAADQSTSISSEDEKGSKTLADTKKRRNVINSAQKTAERKFAELKAQENDDENVSCACCCQSFCNGAFGAWADAYKNIFNFKGRTSRFEFWSFMLINFFVILGFFGGLILLPYDVLGNHETLLSGIILVFMGIQAIISLSLSVRRIHDTGNSAWKGFYRPFICLLVLMMAIGFVSSFYLSGANNLTADDHTGFLYLLITYLLSTLLFPFYLYYLFKLFITVCFIEEDNRVLECGEPRYADPVHKKRAMKYAAIYFVIMVFVSIFSVAFLQFYITALAMYNGGM